MPKRKKIIEARFDQRMRDSLPQFKRTRYTDVREITSYVCKVADDLFFHLMLRISRYLLFTSDVCWMTNDRSPIWARVGRAHDPPDDPMKFAIPNENGLMFGITHLWSKHDLNWMITDEDWQAAGDGGFRTFTRTQLNDWILTHPQFYPDEPQGDDRLIWPLVDHMVEQIHEFAIPYFQKIARDRGYDWSPTSSQNAGIGQSND